METSIRLSCDVRSVGEARRFVVRALDRFEGFNDPSDAELLTSEVVTNAVIHGGSDVIVAVRYDPATSTVTVEVHDEGSDRPRQASVQDQHATSGRGLAIVGEVAESWGVRELPGDGKVVWFALRGD